MKALEPGVAGSQSVQVTHIDRNVDASRKKMLGKLLLTPVMPLNRGRHLLGHQRAFRRPLDLAPPVITPCHRIAEPN